MTPRPAPSVPVWQMAALPAGAATLTSAAYRLWLGWHELVRDNRAYEPWQVVGLALTLGLMVIAAAWRSTERGVVVAAVVTVTLTAVWSWDAATTPNPQGDANLWPVGAFFLFCGVSVAFAVVVGVTHVVTTILRQPPRPTT